MRKDGKSFSVVHVLVRQTKTRTTTAFVTIIEPKECQPPFGYAAPERIEGQDRLQALASNAGSTYMTNALRNDQHIFLVRMSLASG